MLDPAELRSLLVSRGICIVHFSHHANMREGGVFPDDLLAAIEHSDQWNLSCCALWPGHQMALPGDVGLIFEVDHPNQILSVCADDAGASQTDDGAEVSGGLEPTKETIEASLAVPLGGYNEWRVKGARVAGIYVENPDSICVKQKLSVSVQGTSHEVIAAVQIRLDDIKAEFGKYQLFTLSDHGLAEI
ncbi:MAG: hypothetical protein RIE24_13740 [Silicimonas sp.]